MEKISKIFRTSKYTTSNMYLYLNTRNHDSARVLDPNIRQLHKNSVSSDQIPNLDTLVSFVQHRCNVLENVKGNLSFNMNSANGGTHHDSPNVALAVSATSTPLKICSYYDNQSHPIHRCFAFKKLAID